MCVGIAPHLFQLDDRGKLNVLIEEPGEDKRAKLEECVRLCPRQAIKIE